MADALNTSQLQAATWSGGPLIVLAGPGTGKTRVIAHRVRWLLEQGADPASIVAVTYTVKAANQLRDRVASFAPPEQALRVNIHTFHGLGMRLLRRFGDVLGLPPDPDLIDSAQTKRLLRELVIDLKLFPHAIASGRDASIQHAAAVMNTLQDHAIDPADALARADAWIAAPRDTDDEGKADLARAHTFREQARLYDAFDKARRRRGWLSFGDLITLPIRLLKKDGFAADICRGEFKRFIIDEFQDSNPAQLALLRQLAPARRAEICVVGDDDQSIYAFRGADDRAFEQFAKAWPDAKRIRLTENYRSVPEIVAATNRIISLAERRFDPDKIIVAAGDRRDALPGGVECVKLEDDDQDASVIAASILSDRAANPDRSFGAYAVLARGHADLDRAAAALELEGIPVRRQRARSPLDDAGVQDVLAWARLLAGNDETWSARRILLRPPYAMDPLIVTTWEKLYRVHVQQAGRAGQFFANEYIPWLAARRAEALTGADTAPGFTDERLASFLARHDELKALASAAGADDAIYQIITRCDAAHADLPAEAGGLARSRRVADLVALARFVRTRRKRLAPPGDLAAFLEYYDDLDESEQKLGALGDERIDPFAESDPEAAPSAVTLLTAHSAKGLEFDTVFVMRVQPRNGFGKVSREDHPDLPPAILGRAAAHDDALTTEARRLFYVACTRAERRLVLLARNNKSKSKAVHFFEEFTRDPAGAALVTIREARDVFDEADRRGVKLRGGAALSDTPATDFRALLARARSRARLAATVALEAADRPDLTPAALADIAASLRDAAGRLAITSSVEHSAALPEWSAQSDLWTREAADLAAGKAASLTPGFEFRPPGPRLDLSFTSIRDYQRCPRCWYVKHVMRIPERESRELNTGAVVHRALQLFAQRRQAADADGLLPPGLDTLAQLCAQEAAREAGPLRHPSVDELNTIVALARSAIETLDTEPVNIVEIERELTFGYPRNGERHSIHAKIDRIDQLPDGRIRIIDYKTGHPYKYLLTPKADDLQLAIYAMAAATLYGAAEPPPGVAQYWLLASGQRGEIALDALDLAAVRTEIDTVIDGLLAGRFPKLPEGCSGACDILGEESL